MGKFWVYKYEISDTNSGETTFYDEWTYSSKKEAMNHLNIDYIRDGYEFKIIDGFFSDCRAWHSTEDCLLIEYDVYSIEK